MSQLCDLIINNKQEEKTKMRREMMPEWAGFTDGKWVQEINLRDFIQRNYKPYEGDKDFLAGPTQATTDLWNQVLELSSSLLK